MKFINHQEKIEFHSISHSKPEIAAYLFLIIATLLLTGCTKNPAEQCLDSFRDDLISPRSAKAVKLIDGNLTYLAKNRSGTEIQGRAICVQLDGKWVRDTSAEYVEILEYSTHSLELNNNCRREGNPRSHCDDLHPVVTLEIAKIKLGYN